MSNSYRLWRLVCPTVEKSPFHQQQGYWRNGLVSSVDAVLGYRARRRYFLRCSKSVMCTMKSKGTKKHGISTSGRRCIRPVL